MKWPRFTFEVASLAAIGVLAFLLVGQCDANKTLAAQIGNVEERGRLDKAGLQYAREREGIEKDEQIAWLQGQLKAQHISSEPVAVVHGTTGPVTVGGNPQGASPPSAPPAAAPAPAQPSSLGGGPACLLSAGDRGEIRVVAAGVKTASGNVVVSGSAEAWRLAPDALLFGGPLKLDIAVSPQVPGSKTAGWGVGAATVLTRAGWSIGPAVAAPSLSLWKLHLDASAGVTLGSGGEWAATGMIIGRVR